MRKLLMTVLSVAFLALGFRLLSVVDGNAQSTSGSLAKESRSFLQRLNPFLHGPLFI
jgi:hypothetical protein